MKERIVIKQDWLVKDMKAGVPELDKLFICQKVEQVPETFEELKELCKGIKGVEYAGGNTKGEIIEISNIWFAENGEIWGYTDDFTGICNISKDRTPQQMWGIIKNLIGE